MGIESAKAEGAADARASHAKTQVPNVLPGLLARNTVRSRFPPAWKLTGCSLSLEDYFSGRYINV